MRLIPKKHKFNYRVFSLFLDLDFIDKNEKKYKFLKLNKFGLLSFYNKDHASRTKNKIKPWVNSLLIENNLPKAHKVFLLSFPRILGFGFNPLSVYFCYNNKSLSSIIYEVKNTFGDQIPYVFKAQIDKDGKVRHSQKKEMYVSPFINMNQIYHFSIHPPDKKIAIRIKEDGDSGKILIATQNAVSKELTDYNLFMTLISYPLMGIKVTLAIHWHALRLFFKGLSFYSYSEWVSSKYGYKKEVNK
tara:strand:+ start:106 stop:840 length:735 start_codon:yes stop_codon:yes gene_type:complete